MRIPRPIGLLAAIIVSVAPLVAHAEEDVRTLDRRFRDVAQRAIPATVLVKSTVGGPRGEGSGFGSGATISADGFILTCAHVVENATEVEVTYPSGDSYPARICSQNTRQDYALLKIDAKGLPAFPLGDSRGLRLGEWVVALGHPGGPYPDLQPAFSVGRITGLHRRLPVQMMERNYDDAIRTDAPIYAGNSGGPLVTLEGKLVGINGAILLVNENSYAVPIHDIEANLERMKRGEPVPGREGDRASAFGGPMEEFEGKDLAKFLGRAGKKLFGKDGLGKLLPGSGGENDELARMLEGIGKSLEGERGQKLLENLFKAFGGDGTDPGQGKGGPPALDLEDLQKRMGELFGGGDKPFGGKDLQEGLKGIFDLFGGGPKEPTPRIEAPEAEPELNVFLGVVPDPEAEVLGAKVLEVLPGSPAAAAGIQVGDVIVRLGDRQVRRPDDLGTALAGKAPGQTVEVGVLRAKLVKAIRMQQRLLLDVKLAPREEGK